MNRIQNQKEVIQVLNDSDNPASTEFNPDALFLTDQGADKYIEYLVNECGDLSELTKVRLPISLKTDFSGLDINGNQIQLPKYGDKVLCDGYVFSVIEVVPNRDICIIASITLRGESGTCEIGYYDFLKHEKVES